MKEMTPLEAAKILESKYNIHGPLKTVRLELYAREVAVVLLRKIAAGEYKPMVHGKWVFGDTLGRSWMKCNKCLVLQSGQTATFTYCPNCGAKMGDCHE